jgi:uncharacterized integral membrane protein
MMFFSGLSRALAMKSGWGIGGPSHFFDDFANNLTGYIAFNCFLAIPGLLGGWIFWRIPAGRTQRPPAQLYRRWEDLRGWRLSLGLCLGPIAMALIYDLIRVLDMGVTAEEFVAETILILVIGIGWTMISGWAYLLAVARQRRRIARRECLLLGTIVAVLMPLALLVIVFAMQGQAGVAETFGTEGSTEWPIVSALFVFSLFGVLGVLGGWLFWRFGVRPTPEPDPDVSAVFE